MTILVNHVMSNEVHSNIFDSIISYFLEFSTHEFQHIVSVKPEKNASVYHYHRPHLEDKLLPNSVCTVHHDLNDPDPWHAKYRFIPRYNEAGKIICLNHTQKDILVNQGISVEKCVVIPHGYNEKVLSLRSKIDKTSNKINLGVASRRYARRVKGEAYLFELAKRLDPDLFRFTFVGKDRSLSALILSSQLGFEVKAYERLPYRLFQSFYNDIDVLLMCSSHEGGPANIPEALATGTPIFSSPIGIAKDVISDGENGLFLSLDADWDAMQIQKICIENPEIFEKIRLNSFEKNRELAITWSECIKKNLSIYEQIVLENK